MAETNRTVSTTPLLDSLAPEQARHVLYHLLRTDPAIAARAEDIAGTLLSDVCSDSIAEMLAYDLSCLAIEDVWDTSGRIRGGGYVDTTDRAWEMMDEVLSSYTDEMTAYINRDMPDESRHYCLGILMGLRHIREEDTPLCEEVPDYCSDTFDIVREEWEKAIHDTEQIALLARALKEKELV
jgi:hypothetical protein